MNNTRIQVPLPEPHFEDESTIVSARQVVPIARARFSDWRRKVLALLPVLLAATLCGALGAMAVNYFERPGASTSAVQSPITETRNQEPKSEVAVASQSDEKDDTLPTPDASPPSEGSVESSSSQATESRPENLAANRTSDAKSVEALIAPKHSTSDSDPKKLVRRRRVNAAREPQRAPQNEGPKSRGAGRIQDIFAGPNP
jgi:hypothetical protein